MKCSWPRPWRYCPLFSAMRDSRDADANKSMDMRNSCLTWSPRPASASSPTRRHNSMWTTSEFARSLEVAFTIVRWEFWLIRTKSTLKLFPFLSGCQWNGFQKTRSIIKKDTCKIYRCTIESLQTETKGTVLNITGQPPAAAEGVGEQLGRGDPAEEIDQRLLMPEWILWWRVESLVSSRRQMRPATATMLEIRCSCKIGIF